MLSRSTALLRWRWLRKRRDQGGGSRRLGRLLRSCGRDTAVARPLRRPPNPSALDDFGTPGQTRLPSGKKGHGRRKGANGMASARRGAHKQFFSPRVLFASACRGPSASCVADLRISYGRRLARGGATAGVSGSAPARPERAGHEVLQGEDGEQGDLLLYALGQHAALVDLTYPDVANRSCGDPRAAFPAGLQHPTTCCGPGMS